MDFIIIIIIIIIILLALIASCEIMRLVLTHRKTSKKAHFKQKLDGTEKMIWDLEFKVFKTREVREDVRQEYDYMIQRIGNLKNQFENFPATGDLAEKARITDQIILAERDRDRFLEQIKMIDLEIEGSKPTAELPDGASGIVNQIESLRELLTMLKDWIKKL